MELLTKILFSISNALLIPCVLSLLLLTAWMCLSFGGFLREWLVRRRNAPRWERFREELESLVYPAGHPGLHQFFERDDYPGFLSLFAKQGKTLTKSGIHLSRLISGLEIAASGRVARMNFGTRVGPMLGLMGTLIPLGPALLGLSAGNIEALANNLVIAFATTVVGLLIGGVCYGIALVRQRWYAQDLSNIEYLFACLTEPFSDGDADHALQ